MWNNVNNKNIVAWKNTEKYFDKTLQQQIVKNT